MLKDISAAIASIGGMAEFALEETASADIGVRVPGVGRLRFPITGSVAKKLIAIAKPSPFGYREETRYDESVRNSWEIDGEDVEIDGACQRVLAEQLSIIRRRLGLPKEGELSASLDKMLIYGPGQFFAPHQDSEREDGMLATMVVLLPARHVGGDIVVEHDGTQQVLGSAAGESKVGIVAFYADCRHEVRRVEHGYRISLTFHVIHEGAEPAEGFQPASGGERMLELIGQYFATPVPPKYGAGPGERPDRLVYLLDHEYTEKGLGWKHLKGADRERVTALLSIADALDCEASLALADIHETWEADGYDGYDGDGYGRQRGRGRRRWEEEETAAEDYPVTSLIDSETDLFHMVDREGHVEKGVPNAVRGGEIALTRESDDLKPYKSEHEGWMGNYGNTVDRWYHRAAFVMWPKSRTFALRAKQSPDWAIKDISRRVKTNRDEALRDSKSLLPFWSSRATAQEGAPFFQAVTKLAVALGDAELAGELLAPFGPDRLTEAGIPPLLKAFEQFGPAWPKQLFTAWRKHGRARTEALRTILPALSRALAAADWSEARPFGAWLLREELNVLRAETGAESFLGTYGRESQKRFIRDVTAMFESVAAVDAKDVRTELVDFLTDAKTGLSVTLLGETLQSCYEGRKPKERQSLGLGELHARVLRASSDALAKPPRAEDDWSIVVDLKHTCDLCKTLTAFLRDPRAAEKGWPLAETDRRHVHSQIDRFALPVEHNTIRKGRPYTLMLRKLEKLFEREEVERDALKKLQKWLTSKALTPA